jgi:hypothetical protein
MQAFTSSPSQLVTLVLNTTLVIVTPYGIPHAGSAVIALS